MADSITIEASENLSTQAPIFRARHRNAQIKVGQNITVADGQLKILAQDDTGAFIEFTDLTLTNGASRPIAFLGHTVNATAGAVNTHIYTAGEVVLDKISFATGITIGAILTGEPKGTTVRAELEQHNFTFVNQAKVQV